MVVNLQFEFSASFERKQGHPFDQVLQDGGSSRQQFRRFDEINECLYLPR